MAQPSVACYFNNRKRSAVEDHKIDSARKVLILDQEESNETKTGNHTLQISTPEPKRILTKELITGSGKTATLAEKNASRKIVRVSKTKKAHGGTNVDIQNFLNNMKKIERCVTPPNVPEREANKDLNSELNQIKKTICRSSNLKELKESINRFKESAEQLKAVEKKTSEISQSPKLKTFKSLEFEVLLSPQKVSSPEKPYLSPKKETSVRRNLLNVLSPTKKSSTLLTDPCSRETTDGTAKQSLQLPFKYRTLHEVFRAIDTVTQILYNRKELITFKKLKPAVEEMVKRNVLQKHLAQIKRVYPNAYDYRQEKIKLFCSGSRQDQWDLVVTPNLNSTAGMTSQVLLERRRKFHEILIDKIKDYHNEFLLSLTPPMRISKNCITRWHPDFDLEKVPDIELAELPQPPHEEVFTSGKAVLEKARQMFNCNTRMEQALLKLKEARERVPVTEQEGIAQPISVLKGIPKALLEKVRQKQAAKALVSMTRTVDKEKEVQLYSRLPEIARLTRSLFVTEKKSVLELDVVVEKLGNSYRSFLTKLEIEDHLKRIAKEVPDWLIFHKLRGSVFLKLAKNADLSLVINKLEQLAKEKFES